MSVTTKNVMKSCSTVLIALGAVFAAPVSAADETANDISKPVVVELFLSQSCIRCPKAAELFPKTAARDNVVALSWHVDYWNMTNTRHGRWADPFSKAEYTARQKNYNANIRHRSSVYTPQIVVNGAAETVGAVPEKIDALIESTDSEAPSVVASREGGILNFTVGQSDNGGNAYLVTFMRNTNTDITSGGNKGMTFNEINVVTDMKPLGIVRRRGGTLSIDQTLAENEGCALIVQSPQQGAIITAAYCPA